MNWAEILGIIGGSITAAAAAARYALGFYFKKANQLQDLKEKTQRQAVESLAHEMLDTRTAVSGLQRELNEMRVKLQETTYQMKEFERISTIMQKQWERTAEQMEKRYRAMENAEIIKVGENNFILKTRP